MDDYAAFYNALSEAEKAVFRKGAAYAIEQAQAAVIGAEHDGYYHLDDNDQEVWEDNIERTLGNAFRDVGLVPLEPSLRETV